MSTSLSSLPPAVIDELLAGPAGTPPQGVLPYFGGPRSPYLRGNIIQAVIVWTVCISCVTARISYQHFVADGLDAEDYIMILAMINQIALDVIGILNVAEGMGKHIWDLTLRHYLKAYKLEYVFSNLYVPCLALVKIAILLQLIRIFAPSRVNKKTWFVCWTCIVINIVVYTVIEFLQIFQCIPVNMAWWPFQKGHCINIGNVYKANGVFNIFSDFAILFIPLPIIFTLQMTLRRKFLIAAVFAVGSGACAASIVRCYFTWRLVDSKDVSYYSWWLGLFCTIEIAVGIVVFCMPLGPSLYFHMKSKIKNLSTRSGSVSELTPTPVSFSRVSPEKSTRHPYAMPSLASFEEGHGPHAMPSVLQLQGLSRISSTSDYKPTTSQEKGGY